MVLAGDLAKPAAEVFDRVIKATVSVVKFVSGQTSCQREQLLTEADAEKRLAVCEHLLHGIYCIRHGSRVARAV